MRRRWYGLKRFLRTNRPLVFLLAFLFLMTAVLIRGRKSLKDMALDWFQGNGVRTAGRVMREWFPASIGAETEGFLGWIYRENPLFSYLAEMEKDEDYSEDPAYERLLKEKWIRQENGGAEVETEKQAETEGQLPESDSSTSEPAADGSFAGEVIALKPAGSGIIREKLADYDYLMKSFYSVHPTTTAGRDLMNAEKFLSMDLSIEKSADVPQILIYHTHSQEEFADYPENPEATIVGVGTYLADLLEQKGYQVIHDTSVYDVQDGKLDRSSAYTYALDGITGILQKYPSIQVVLDIHRDGVQEGTHLVKEINGKQTAQIMFFNGISQTPDGPIEYLPNPNREANLAFSFQLQLLAAEKYPGFTRKIYLKGLRYNQHVRARTALVEVGAQTNTYEEAKNAMEPLSELLDEVLGGGT